MQGLDRRLRPAGVGERLDWALACLLTAAFSGPGMMLLGATNDPNAPPTPMLRLYWPPVYAVGLILLARRWRFVARAWPAALALAAPVAWAALSQRWSIAPDDTGRRALALGLTTLCGVVLGGAFAPRQAPRIVAVALTGLGVASIALALLLPRYGVEQEVNVGCWRGLWLTKNALGAYMAIGTLAALCSAESARRPWSWLAAAGLCGFVLAMSRGKTALVCLALALSLLAIRRIGRGGAARAVVAAWLAGTGALVAGFVAFVAPGVLLEAVGKDATLTGRTEIWSAVFGQAMQRPLTGFGFAAFWTQGSIPAKIVDRQTGWTVPEAHNTWLDLLAALGWVGAGLTAGCCLLATALAFARMRGRADGLFAPAYAVMVLAMSVTESVVLEGNNVIWLSFVAMFAAVASVTASRTQPLPRPVAMWPHPAPSQKSVAVARP